MLQIVSPERFVLQRKIGNDLVSEPLLIADPLQQLRLEGRYGPPLDNLPVLDIGERKDRLHSGYSFPCEQKNGETRTSGIISEIGMRCQLCCVASMEKSIFTPEQEALQRVLRQLRLGAGLRQEDLALRLNEPQSFVSKYESGERRLDLIELRQVCQAVGVTLRELIERFEEQLHSCSRIDTSSDSPKPFGPTSGP